LEEMAQVMENLGQNSTELIKAVMIRND
jgi:hypothetical protein